MVNPAFFNDLLSTIGDRKTIKDSFQDAISVIHNLDTLFTAQWYGYEPNRVMEQGFRYPSLKSVQSDDQLEQWIYAWGEPNTGRSIFNNELVDDDGVTLVYLRELSTITCGAALFEKDNVMGITNLFGSKEEQQRLVRTIQISYPDKTLVGYGDEAELTLLKPFGFRELGKLSVLTSN